MTKTTRRKTTVKARATTITQEIAPPTVELDITTRDPEGRTPLHLAAWYGYTATVRRMLLQHAEVDARDSKERTPAHWSAFKGYLEVIKLLVENGADVNARDAGGRTVLQMAMIGKQEAVEAFIRSHGGTI